ncbi:hypothetical protein POM88_002574 [Heracleum sosnowskyi]|uniref:Uncharacterized protein n=1 Tax=Heracleum sosnowskyi TaxID=360622 RepID=A0AAD8JEY8_9APIA|nr:hypothetical protein POM88_002574 [Heracleum sosnowskyi]
MESGANKKDSWLTCLPALTTLCLYDWDLSRNRDLSQSSFSFSLPALKTLHLSHCIILPKTVWDLPALISLQLDTMHLPENLSDTFSALVNLQNLTLNLSPIGDYFITCPPQLLNLSIKSGLGNVNIVVSAPKLCNFTFFGIFIVTILVPEPENINIRLQGWFQDSKLKYRKKYYQRLTNMLPGLGNAKTLTFDLESIEALNKISDLLVSLPSPFYNLKFVKLPWGFKESSISSALRNYLLGGSPKAAIGTKFPQNTMDYQEVPRCLTSQKFMLDEALATNVNDRASSSRGNSDFGLWRGHEVNPDFVGLLDLIITKYPETFEQFISKSEKFYTMKLNMLCTSVYEFLRTSLTEFNTDIITEYRDLFTDLQRWGFNVNWLLSHLKYIEHFQISQYELHSIDSRPDDAKNKLQDLQSHCLGKITEIEKASG